MPCSSTTSTVGLSSPIHSYSMKQKYWLAALVLLAPFVGRAQCLLDNSVSTAANPNAKWVVVFQDDFDNQDKTNASWQAVDGASKYDCYDNRPLGKLTDLAANRSLELRSESDVNFLRISSWYKPNDACGPNRLHKTALLDLKWDQDRDGSQRDENNNVRPPSIFTIQRGLFEIRCRLTKYAGLDPNLYRNWGANSSFWLYSHDMECDIFEATDGKAFSTNVHNWHRRYPDGELIPDTASNLPEHFSWNEAYTYERPTDTTPYLDEAFHTYSAVWSGEKITFFFDGRELSTISANEPFAPGMDMYDAAGNIFRRLAFGRAAIVRIGVETLDKAATYEQAYLDVDYIRISRPQDDNGTPNYPFDDTYTNIKTEQAWMKHDVVTKDQPVALGGATSGAAYYGQADQQVKYAYRNTNGGINFYSPSSQSTQVYSPTQAGDVVAGDVVANTGTWDDRIYYRSLEGTVQWAAANYSGAVYVQDQRAYLPSGDPNRIPFPAPVSSDPGSLFVMSNGVNRAVVGYIGTDNGVHTLTQDPQNGAIWHHSLLYTSPNNVQLNNLIHDGRYWCFARNKDLHRINSVGENQASYWLFTGSYIAPGSLTADTNGNIYYRGGTTYSGVADHIYHVNPNGQTIDIFNGPNFQLAQGKVQAFGEKVLYTGTNNKINLLYRTGPSPTQWVPAYPGSWDWMSPIQVASDGFYGDPQGSTVFYHQPQGSIAYNTYENCEVKKLLSNPTVVYHDVHRTITATQSGKQIIQQPLIEVTRQGAQLAIINRSQHSIQVLLTDLVGRTYFTGTLSAGERRLSAFPSGVCVIRTIEGNSSSVRKLYFTE
jgi:hypothetical protein